MNRPNSLPEWKTYIENLGGENLFSQAVAANTHTFARTLLEEGATMGDVEQIMLLFVRQLRAIGVKVPEGGPFDLNTMALVDAQARLGVTYTPEEAALQKSLEDPTDDDFAQFELEAGFED